MSRKVWTWEKDELLIELVKNKPALYDLQASNYSDNDYKTKTWNEIKEIVQISDVKLRWESLRSQYRKYLAKLKTKTGQAAKKIQKWRYHDQMQFLNDHIHTDRPRTSSVVDEVDIEALSENNQEVFSQTSLLTQTNDNDEDELATDFVDPVNQSASVLSRNPSTTQNKKIKRYNANTENTSSTLMKFILENKKSEKSIDSIDQFFSLMATTVKTFSLLDQHLVKTQVFSIINQIEAKYLTNSATFKLPTLHSHISLSSSSHSSSPPHFLDKNHSASHDFSIPLSQNTFIQQKPANTRSQIIQLQSQLPNCTDSIITSPTSYYD